MARAKFFLYLIFAIMLSVTALAAQPSIGTVTTIVNSGSEEVIEIKFPLLDTLPFNESYEFNFHLFNRADGNPIVHQSVLCNFHLYNNKGEHIYVLNRVNKTEDLYDYQIFIDKNNFTTLGTYSYLFQCNGTISQWLLVNNTDTQILTHRGGFVEQTFIITHSGEDVSAGMGILYAALLFVVIVLLGLCVLGTMSLNPEDKYDPGGNLIQIDYKRYVKAGLWLLSYLLLLLLMYLAWLVAREFLIQSFLTSILEMIFYSLLAMTIPLFAIVCIMMLMKWFLSSQLTEMAKRRLKPR